MRPGSQPEIGPALPIAQIMLRRASGPGKIGNLIALIAVGGTGRLDLGVHGNLGLFIHRLQYAFLPHGIKWGVLLIG